MKSKNNLRSSDLSNSVKSLDLKLFKDIEKLFTDLPSWVYKMDDWKNIKIDKGWLSTRIHILNQEQEIEKVLEWTHTWVLKSGMRWPRNVVVLMLDNKTWFYANKENKKDVSVYALKFENVEWHTDPAIISNAFPKKEEYLPIDKENSGKALEGIKILLEHISSFAKNNTTKINEALLSSLICVN